MIASDKALNEDTFEQSEHHFGAYDRQAPKVDSRAGQVGAAPDFRRGRGLGV
jgi:hypothetical protein